MNINLRHRGALCEDKFALHRLEQRKADWDAKKSLYQNLRRAIHAKLITRAHIEHDYETAGLGRHNIGHRLECYKLLTNIQAAVGESYRDALQLLDWLRRKAAELQSDVVEAARGRRWEVKNAVERFWPKEVPEGFGVRHEAERYKNWDRSRATKEVEDWKRRHRSQLEWEETMRGWRR